MVEFLKNIPPASDDVVAFFRTLTETEYKPTEDKLLVGQLRLVKNTLKIVPVIIYYPYSGADISPSVAFPDSKVIYIDSDPKVIEDLSANGFEAYQESALTYNLRTKANIVLLINPVIKPGFPSQQVADNGFLLCNDYHCTALEISKNDNFEPLGYIQIVNGDFVYRNDVSDHLKVPSRARDMDELFVFRKRGTL